MSTNRRDDKKLHLINAARAAVSRFGYRKTTLEDIAAEAGVSRATLYYHFPNKEEVFRALISNEIERFQAVLIDALDADAPPDARLLGYVRARFKHLREVKSLYSVTKHFAREFLPMADEDLARFEEAEHGFIVALLREGMASGRFRQVDPDVLGGALLAAIHGLDERFIFEDREALGQGAECLLDTLFTGLVAPDSDPS
jgi:TetR/AcrR family transcriptional regulator